MLETQLCAGPFMAEQVLALELGAPHDQRATDEGSQKKMAGSTTTACSSALRPEAPTANKLLRCPLVVVVLIELMGLITNLLITYSHL